MSLLPLLAGLVVVIGGQVAAFLMGLDHLPGTLASVAAGVAAYVAVRLWASKREVPRGPSIW